MHDTTIRSIILASLVLVALVACQATEADAPATPGAAAAPEVTVPHAEPIPSDPYERALLVSLETTEPIEGTGLHNVFHLGDRIISGSEPHGEAAFAELAAMGVKTILTVDGKAPDVEAARRHGMRYVHVPIEYSGIAPGEIARIAKTFHELEGPFYVHCFHGRHRGPAAAAVGRLALDGVPREQALAEMRQWCGTSKKYGGLYRTIAEMEVPTALQSRAFDWDFPERQVLDGFRAVMIETVRARDNLKMLSKRDWEADPRHPDVDLLNEAQKILELYVAGSELEEVKGEDADFRGWMRDGVEAGRDLEKAARALRERPRDGAVKLEATRAWSRLAATCTACHAVYRD